MAGTYGKNHPSEGPISYSNAIDLLRLADLAAARYGGVTLAEISGEFGVHERTAQRMVRALAEVFPHAIEMREGDDRRRRWRLREVPIARRRLQGARELEGLESGIDALNARGDQRFAASGWLEMAWHLLCWGDSVEVVKPGGLKAMLADPNRNSDVLP